MRRFPRTLPLLAATLLGVSACSSLSDVLSPGRPGESAPAQLALAMSIPRSQTTGTSPLVLTIVSGYERADNSLQPLDSTTLLLSELATQQVPVTIDLARCLADTQRRNASADPSGCQVRFILSLLRDGRVLDVAALGPLRLAAGSVTAAPGTIELFEIATVFLSEAPGTTPLQALDTIVTGGTRTLRVNARDATGAEITDRPVAWASSNTTVASVSGTGVVTGVAPGTARITGTVGGRAASIEFVVTPPRQRLAVTAVPSSGTGRITSSPAGIDCTLTAGVASGACDFDFVFGTAVQLTSSITPGTAIFNGWSGACLASGTGPTCSLTLTEPRTVGASYTQLTAVSVVGQGSGVRVTSAPITGIDCTLGSSAPGSCTATFTFGTTVTLTAAELATSRVRGWEGCDSTTRTSCTLTVGATARTVTLLIDAPRPIIISSSGDGRGLVTSPAPASGATGLVCGYPPGPTTGICSVDYPVGSTVLVTATAESGSRFARWSDGPCNGSSERTCAVTIGSEPSVQFGAVFESALVPITLQLSGTGGGRVLRDAVVVCELSATQTSTQCVIDAALGDILRLGGTPLGSGQFLGFGGACLGGTSCTREVTGPLTITAEFSAEPATGTIVVVPGSANGSNGVVLSSDEELACELSFSSATGECEITRPAGTVVTLTAFDIPIGEGGYGVFRRWSAGSPCAGSVLPTCAITVARGTTTVGAEFGDGVVLDLFLQSFGGANPQIDLSVAVADFRPLDACAFRGEVNGVFCFWILPVGGSVTVSASTGTGFEFDLTEAQFCSWSVSGTSASCSFAPSINTFADIYVFAAGDSMGFNSALRRAPRRPPQRVPPRPPPGDGLLPESPSSAGTDGR